jgi:DNA polymerase V
MSREKQYIAIDLKSFFASCECVRRGLDPMITNLVVADESRTDKTICLAVTPALKSFGVPGRPRLFEVKQKVAEINALRRQKVPGRQFADKSSNARTLTQNPALELDFIIAPPHMADYMARSTQVYQIYLRFIAPEDIHVYSIDEVFIDATPYLKTYGMTAYELAREMIAQVLQETGITATAGIGTNLYLCKVAMDIVAKHIEPDADGVRIAQLDEMSYRRLLWDHRPLTDFWRVGRGYAKKLESHGMFTMGDVARCSLTGEDVLYKLFGINAELLIDHAWGWESCTLSDIKTYRPSANSLGSGQVLHSPYSFEKARLILQEMTDLLVMDLVDKGLETDKLVLTIGYDRENLTDPSIRAQYTGVVCMDHYGRPVPQHAHGTANLHRRCASTRLITRAMLELYDRIVDPALLVRRVNIAALNVTAPGKAEEEWQLDLFSDIDARDREERELEREGRRQRAMLDIRKKYGKNAILKGMNFMEGATTRDRNAQIGGHKA